MNRLRITFLAGLLLVVFSNLGQCTSIGQSRALKDGATAMVTGAITLLEPAGCYIESPDRSAGIWVQADTTGTAVGNLVTATGTMGTASGERVIQNAALSLSGGNSAPAPLGMRNIWLGGKYSAGDAVLQDYLPHKIPGDGVERRWETTSGLGNVGLLVKTWGRVTAVCYSPGSDAHYFHLDDGSGVVADYGDSGVIVYSDANVKEGDFVTVTGVSSVEVALDDATRLVRIVRPRSAEDVSVAKAAEAKPVGPISDEFDGTSLNSAWTIFGNRSCASLSALPGWLTLTCDTTTQYSPALIQAIDGDFDMEVKVRPSFDPWPTDYYSFNITLWPFVLNSMQNNYSASPSYRVLNIVRNNVDARQIWLFNVQYAVDPGDTYWVKIRVRRPAIYASVSADGTNYCTEQTGTCAYPYILLWAHTSHPGTAYAPLVDYVRVTRADQ